MSAWTSDELTKIQAAEEVQIAPRRPDGTLRNPVTVWVVRQGDDVYIRSAVKGRNASCSAPYKTRTRVVSRAAAFKRT
jgi:hypothetical protein